MPDRFLLFAYFLPLPPFHFTQALVHSPGPIPTSTPQNDIKVEKHSKALGTQILVFANLMRLRQSHFSSHEALDIKEAILPL